MDEFKSNLRNKMYYLIEEVVKIVHIGESLHDHKALVPTKIEAEAFISAYNFAIEARGLFRLYNQIFPGEEEIMAHYNLISEGLEKNIKYIVNRIACNK